MKAQTLVETLKLKHLTIGSVESMTGGLFASKITEVSGASDVFKGAIVAYGIQSKENLANVRPQTIEKFGVISWEVASEMAYNGRTLLDVDYCLAVTGNAGPTLDHGEKEIGTVFIAIASKDNVWGIPLTLKGDREQIREQAVVMMLDAIQSIVK